MDIRTANENEYELVRGFYHSLITEMKASNSQYLPGWEIDIYPSPEYLRSSIDKKELYVGEVDGQFAACMVMNHDCNEGYKQLEWPTAAEPEEITVIHTLGVHPAFAGKGYAGEMVNKAIAVARDNSQKVIRLDVLKGNLPAEKLYIKNGFVKCGTVQMFYEDTGWTDFEMFEYVI